MIRNYAFIDGQNLHLATTKADVPWVVDLKKFRYYLEQKYRVTQAYYFFGVYEDTQRDMYEAIQEYGYITVFREHGANLKGKKKGNVDVDIVFSVMRKLYEREEFDRVVMVSGDGDYRRMVDFLIKEGRFEKMLLPNERYASSLYKALRSRFYDYLDTPGMKIRIGLRPKNEKGS